MRINTVFFFFFLYFFLENRVWHSMQTVSQGDNLHTISILFSFRNNLHEMLK